jgi:hypothetical protein
MRIFLACLLALSTLSIEPAIAQQKQGLIGNLVSRTIAKIQTAALDDLQIADAIAQAQGDAIAHSCWAAWINFIKQEQSVLNPGGKAVVLPTLHLLTDFQRARSVLQALQPTSPLTVACAPLANAVKMDVVQLLTTAASGVLLQGMLLP